MSVSMMVRGHMWRTLVIGVVSLVVLASATAGDSRSIARHSVALATSSELVVWRGDEQIAAEPIGPLPWGAKSVLTNDGRHYARLTRPKSPDEVWNDKNVELVIVSVADGRVVRRPCPRCTSAAPIGGSGVMVTTAYSSEKPFMKVTALLVFDAAQDLPPRALTPRPPTIDKLKSESDFFVSLVLIGGLGDTVFAMGYDLSSTIVGVYEIDPLGYVRDWGLRRFFGFSDEDGERWGLVDTVAIPLHIRAGSGIGVALASTYEISTSQVETGVGCTRHATVDVFSGAGRIVTLRMDEALRAAGMDPAHQSTLVTKIWQTGDGLLHSVVRVRDCDDSAEEHRYQEFVFDGHEVSSVGAMNGPLTFDSGAGAITVSEDYLHGERPFTVLTAAGTERADILDMSGTPIGVREVAVGALPLDVSIPDHRDRSRLTAVRPIDNSRNLLPGYVVEREAEGTCGATRHRLIKGVLQCEIEATISDLCWAGAQDRVTYCLPDILGKKVIKVHIISEKNPVSHSWATSDAVVRRPLAIRLVDQRICRIGDIAPEQDPPEIRYRCDDGSTIEDNPSAGPTSFVSDGTAYFADHRGHDGTLTRIPIEEIFFVAED